MGENAVKTRNQKVDIIRGIAIIMVVIGHLITNNTTGSEGTPFYNVIWSCQMPLFFLISGYITRYSKPIDSAKKLFSFIGKRTISYILPWFTCQIIIRALAMFGVDLAVKKFTEVVWNLDGGYWFLWVLWFICIMFGVASFIANKITKRKTATTFATLVTAGVLTVIPLALGLTLGFNFFGMKLMLYYIPFYFLGYLVSQVDAGFEADEKKNALYKKTKEILYLPILVVYIYFVWHYDLYSMTEGIVQNAIRILASLTGAYVVCHMASNLKESGRIAKFFDLAGRYSLEIYILHYLVLSRIGGDVLPAFTSVEGVIRCVVNLSVAIVLTVVLICALSANKYAKFLCFGKKK